MVVVVCCTKAILTTSREDPADEGVVGPVVDGEGPS